MSAQTIEAEIAREAAARVRWQRQPDDPHTHTLSLPDFLRTGELGPIHLGMTRTAILGTLGKPGDWSIAENRAGLPEIFKYGDIEFYFLGDEDVLTGLHADTFDALTRVLLDLTSSYHVAPVCSCKPFTLPAHRQPILPRCMLGAHTSHELIHRRSP
jgi:hypothetical protein